MDDDRTLPRRSFLQGIAGSGMVASVYPTGQQSAAAARGDWVNVRDFGALGDNRTDDTDAIRRAVTEARSSEKHVVYLPHGSYVVTDSIVLRDAVALVGDGLDVSMVKHRGAGDAVVITGTAAANLVKTSLRHLTVLGDGSASRTGLRLSYAPYGTYHNVRVSGFATAISIEHSWCLSFEQVTAEDARQDGWFFGVEANNVGTRNCVALRCARAGYYVRGARGLVLLDCDAEENGTGVVFAADINAVTEKASIAGGYYEGNKTEEVAIRSDGGRARPKAITIRDAYFVRVDRIAQARGVAVRVRDVATLLVEGCHFSARGHGYTSSVYLTAGGSMSGVVLGAGNLDESSAGPRKGRGTTLTTVATREL